MLYFVESGCFFFSFLPFFFLTSPGQLARGWGYRILLPSLPVPGKLGANRGMQEDEGTPKHQSLHHQLQSFTNPHLHCFFFNLLPWLTRACIDYPGRGDGWNEDGRWGGRVIGTELREWWGGVEGVSLPPLIVGDAFCLFCSMSF